MKLRRPFILTACLILNAFSALPARAVDAPGLVLERQDPLGRGSLSICNRGAKIHYPELKFTAVCAAPSWDIVLFNSKNKTIYRESFAHFYKQDPNGRANNRFRDFRGVDVVNAGVHARKISLSIRNPQERRDSLPLPTFGADGQPGAKIVRLSLIVTDELKLPPNLSEFLSSFYASPNAGGIPLAFDETLMSGKVNRRFFTKTIKHEVISDSCFSVPSGYKTAAMDEVYGGALNSQLKDLADDLGLGVGFGDQPKKLK